MKNPEIPKPEIPKHEGESNIDAIKKEIDKTDISDKDLEEKIKKAIEILDERKEKGEGRLANVEKIEQIPKTETPIYDGHLVALPEIKGEGEIFFVGDIHGDKKSLNCIVEKFLEALKEGKKAYIVFLGDLADRGQKQIEVWYTVLTLLEKFPDNVVILRGNHEEDSQAWAQRYNGFFLKLKEKYPEKAQDLIAKFNELFEKLPEVAVTSHAGGIVALHGAPPINMENLGINGFRNPEENLLTQIRWNDPKNPGEMKGSRGRGCYVVGKGEIEQWLNKIGAQYLLRAHEWINWNTYGERVITIFSNGKGSSDSAYQDFENPVFVRVVIEPGKERLEVVKVHTGEVLGEKEVKKRKEREEEEERKRKVEKERKRKVEKKSRALEIQKPSIIDVSEAYSIVDRALSEIKIEDWVNLLQKLSDINLIVAKLRLLKAVGIKEAQKYLNQLNLENIKKQSVNELEKLFKEIDEFLKKQQIIYKGSLNRIEGRFKKIFGKGFLKEQNEEVKERIILGLFLQGLNPFKLKRIFGTGIITLDTIPGIPVKLEPGKASWGDSVWFKGILEDGYSRIIQIPEEIESLFQNVVSEFIKKASESVNEELKSVELEGEIKEAIDSYLKSRLKEYEKEIENKIEAIKKQKGEIKVPEITVPGYYPFKIDKLIILALNTGRKIKEKVKEWWEKIKKWWKE